MVWIFPVIDTNLQRKYMINTFDKDSKIYDGNYTDQDQLQNTELSQLLQDIRFDGVLQIKEDKIGANYRVSVIN